jgi:alkylation response protein AidB-like acyl-CoA dehydrogenase
MEFRFSAAQEQLRQELREFLKEEVDAAREAPVDVINYGEDWDYQLEFGNKLAERGWIAPAWPKKYGGMELGHIEQMIFTEELAYWRAPQGGRNFGVFLLGPALLSHGSEEQREAHLPLITTNKAIWCQGYSEPGSGSDLASLRTTAVRDGDDYIVNGQKIWTSNGHRADWMFFLARTDPDAPKHRGISFFVVPMNTTGIDLRPLYNMAGTHDFNEVFLDNVRVPASNRVGDENTGWYVAMTVLNFERSFIRAIGAARRTIDDLRTVIQSQDGKASREASKALADLMIENTVARLMNYRVGSMQAAGRAPTYESSQSKVISTDHLVRVYKVAMEILGLYGQLDSGSLAPLAGRVARNLLTSTAGPIYSGTNEIQRNIIATRGLDLPRSD